MREIDSGKYTVCICTSLGFIYSYKTLHFVERLNYFWGQNIEQQNPKSCLQFRIVVLLKSILFRVFKVKNVCLVIRIILPVMAKLKSRTKNYKCKFKYIQPPIKGLSTYLLPTLNWQVFIWTSRTLEHRTMDVSPDSIIISPDSIIFSPTQTYFLLIFSPPKLNCANL